MAAHTTKAKKSSHETTSTERIHDASKKQEKNEGLPVYLLIEKEKRKHQATIERMIDGAKKKDVNIQTLKIELDAIKEAILVAPIAPELKQCLLAKKTCSFIEYDIGKHTPTLQLDLLRTKTSILPPISMADDESANEEGPSVPLMAPINEVPDVSSSKFRRYRIQELGLESHKAETVNVTSDVASKSQGTKSNPGLLLQNSVSNPYDHTSSQKMSLIMSSIEKIKMNATRARRLSNPTSLVSETTLRAYENSEIGTVLPPLVSNKGVPSGI